MTFSFDKPLWDKTQPQCILTGIWVLRDDLIARADLHIINNTFVLNCALDNSGDAFWQEAKTQDYESDLLSINITNSPCFERRGVIILSRAVCTLSDGALKYMKGSQ